MKPMHKTMPREVYLLFLIIDDSFCIKLSECDARVCPRGSRGQTLEL